MEKIARGGGDPPSFLRPQTKGGEDCIEAKGMPAKGRTEPRWVTDREGYLIEKGLRRRQWQRQQDAAVGAAASPQAAADATVGAATDNAGTDREGYLIEKGLRRRQWQRQQDAAVGAAASSKAAADAPVGAVMAGAGCAGPACIT